jgi:hypothetical protein
MTGKPFKFDKQQVFLTYAQLDVACQALYDALNAIAPIEWARICRETHEDGNKHLHAVVKFQRRFQSRRADVFDVLGQHPNIQPVRSVPASLAYVTKEGEFHDFGPVPEQQPRRSARDVFELAATADEAEFWISAAEARIPYQYAQRFRQLAHAGEETIQEFDADLQRERADLTITELPTGPQSIVVVGPTGVGKSSWAKRVCPKPALWVRHIDVLRSFRAGYHKSIIFDDMDFKHFPRTAQIHLVDGYDTAHIHARYGHATIPAGITKIFTANEFPFLDDPAIMRRVHLINLF